MNCRIGGSNPVPEAKIDPGPWKGFIFVRVLMLIVELLILTDISNSYSDSMAGSFPVASITCAIFFCCSKPRLPTPSTEIKR